MNVLEVIHPLEFVTFVHILITFIIQQWHIKVSQKQEMLWKPFMKSVEILDVGMS